MQSNKCDSYVYHFIRKHLYKKVARFIEMKPSTLEQPDIFSVFSIGLNIKMLQHNKKYLF